MSDPRSETKQEAGVRGGAPVAGFDCCGFRMGDSMTRWPCGSIMRRHPVVTSAFLTLMGLALIVIPAGAILGIIAFFRTF